MGIQFLTHNNVITSLTVYFSKEAGLSLFFAEKDGEAGKIIERELPQGTLQDLVRGMTIFINKTGIDKPKLSELQGFVNSYKLAQKIHSLHMDLEVAAHPGFQVLFNFFFNGNCFANFI